MPGKLRLRWPWGRPSPPVLAAALAVVALLVGAAGMVLRAGDGDGSTGSGNATGGSGRSADGGREGARRPGGAQTRRDGRDVPARPGRTTTSTQPAPTPTTGGAPPTAPPPVPPPTTAPPPAAPFPIRPGVPTNGLLLTDVRCWADGDELSVTGRIRNLSYPSDLVDLEVSFLDAAGGAELDWDSELFDLPVGASEAFELAGVADAEPAGGVRCTFTAG